MWLLTNQWKPGFCDYHRHAGQVQIRVSLWLRVHSVDDAYIEPPRSLRRIVDYVRTYGLAQTFYKIRSRLAESSRNRKFVAFGYGEVLQADLDSSFEAGAAVAFLAPFHPACVDTVCLAEALVCKLPQRAPDFPSEEQEVLEGAWRTTEVSWDRLAGWSDFSGLSLDPQWIRRTFDALMKQLAARNAAGVELKRRRVQSEPKTPERRAPLPAIRLQKPSAVLFGYGHYAKNVVLPRMSRHVIVTCVHEVDPVQLGEAATHRVDLRTSAGLEEGETYDVYLICGYHHTHAPIAVRALREGAAAVVEKPLATTGEQLEALLTAMTQGTGRLFAAFQRRYSKLNDFLRTDLQLETDSPVHCQCIAYEIPLPARHWYRWPNSRSRIVSNGCHWIDHFLFLNNFSTPISTDVSQRRNGDVNIMMDLENGAALSLTVTEHGSSRLGVREHVIFESGDRTAVILDQRHYHAESSQRRLRNTSVSGRSSYDRMYDVIGRRVAAGEPGDSPLSVRVSTAAMLAADAQLLGV